MTKQYRKYKDTSTEELTKFLVEIAKELDKRYKQVQLWKNDKEYVKTANKLIANNEKEIEAIKKILDERKAIA